MSEQIVIGVTGSFGSGCTTVVEILETNYGFKGFSLSTTLRQMYEEKKTGKSTDQALRSELQDFGNDMRKEYHHHFFAEKTLEKVSKKSKNDCLVFDSIRNVGEIAFFRQVFPNFYLIAVDCAEADRWERVKGKYTDKGLTYANFRNDDRRDKNEEGIAYGQQVALCVDEADYLIRNDNDPMVTTETAFKRRLHYKLTDPISLFRGNVRPPNIEETHMSIAYSASLMSQCIKRQVGAVIVDKNGIVLSIGYNENPRPLKPCYLQFGDCYREIHIENIMGNLNNCPYCNKNLDGLKYPYICPHCKRDVYRELVQDRAISRCTALHAEEKVIINTGSTDLKGCTLYVTTFPCFNCAQKILELGIERVYYVESYPDIDSVKLFDTANRLGSRITIQKFEGVKARAYFKIFDTWRRKKELEILESRHELNRP